MYEPHELPAPRVVCDALPKKLSKIRTGAGLEHTLFMQVSPPVQTTPQPPQLLLSLDKLISQPSPATPLQLAKFALQAKLQALLTQTEAALVRAGQIVPHALQLFGSFRGSMHEPEHAMSGEVHEAEHAPLLHTRPAAHDVPALPPPLPHAPDAPQY